MSITLRRTLTAYLVGVGLLAIYGGEVCPFLFELGFLSLLRTLVIAFSIALVIRQAVLTFLKSTIERGAPDYLGPWRVLTIDLGTWLVAGSGIMLYNFLLRDFPLASGGKLIVGCATLGVFTSTFLALDQEREIILRLGRQGQRTDPQAGRVFSVTTKLMIFLAGALALIGAVVVLVVTMNTGTAITKVQAATELIFVFGVMILGCTTVARNYARNLRLIFEQQLDVFERVQRGNYDHLVPVVSHDEFSVIAHHTNGMIDVLRNREALRGAFGKFVSPAVARSILHEERDSDRQGQLLEVTILFADIRDYGRLVEYLSPQQLISLLNRYFSLVVDAVHGHHGIVDKFIGDAAIAVFGLDGSAKSRDCAVEAALEIRDRLDPFNRDLEARGLPEIDCGIGIHHGPVVAGNMGSKERREYTVIGDTVTMAERVESLSKTLGSSVTLTESVHQDLTTELRNRLEALGSFALPGESRYLPIFGLRESEAAVAR